MTYCRSKQNHGIEFFVVCVCAFVCPQEFDSMKSPADRGRINSDEFVTMFQEMATRPEIYFLLIRFANRDYFTADDFLHFLECEQAVKFQKMIHFWHCSFFPRLSFRLYPPLCATTLNSFPPRHRPAVLAKVNFANLNKTHVTLTDCRDHLLLFHQCMYSFSFGSLLNFLGIIIDSCRNDLAKRGLNLTCLASLKLFVNNLLAGDTNGQMLSDLSHKQLAYSCVCSYWAKLELSSWSV